MADDVINPGYGTGALYDQQVGEKSGGENLFTEDAATDLNRTAEDLALVSDDTGTLNLFNGVKGFSGFYKAYDGLLTAIAFQRANSKMLLDASFLVQTLSIQWGRNIQLQRVLNNTKPVALVGVGNGTLTLGGMVGTYGAFAGLVEDDSKENICFPLSATIAAGTGFVGCDDKGGQQKLSGVGINLSNLLLENINYTHQFQMGDVMMQSATLTFKIGGMGLFPMS